MKEYNFKVGDRVGVTVKGIYEIGKIVVISGSRLSLSIGVEFPFNSLLKRRIGLHGLYDNDTGTPSSPNSLGWWFSTNQIELIKSTNFNNYEIF